VTYHGTTGINIIQLINQGLCEIAFHQQNKIRLTSLAVKFYLKEIGTADHSSKLTRKELKERPKQICSQFLLKHSGDCVMQFLKKMFLPMSSLVMLYAKWKQ
jgi:hypothetical protein